MKRETQSWSKVPAVRGITRQLGKWRGKLMFRWLLVMLMLLGAYQVAAQEAGKTTGFNPEKQFTIVQIEPDAVKEEVRVVFSQPIPLEVIKPKLRLVPPVKINWENSKMSEEGVLTLRGAFKFGARYFINLPDTFTYDRRTYVKSENSFFLADMVPKAEFVDQKSVIERDGRQLLQVRVRNLDNIILEGIKVPPILLPMAVAYEQAPGDWQHLLTQLKAGTDELISLVQGQSGGIFGQRTPLKGIMPIFFTLPREDKQLFATQGEKNKPRAFSLPLTFRQDKEAGAIELIRLQDRPGKEKPTGESRLFRITDLGLTYKLGNQGLLLWVTSVKTGAPVAGIQVLGFTRDLEVFPLGQTDPEGVLTFGGRELEGLSLKQPGRFGVVKRPVDHRQITFLMAGTAGDVSYIAVRPQGNLKPEGVWQVEEGEAVKNRRGYVFTDRGVYRPGEKVSFKGTIREYREGTIAPPSKGHYTFVITSPKGEQVYSQDSTLSEFGSAWGEMVVQPHLPRGTYTLAMKLDTGTPDAKTTPTDEEGESAPGNEAEATSQRPPQEASCTFQVADFKPPRHFVEIAFQRFSRSEQGYVNRPGVREFVRINITGSYYAGGPVKHGQVRWKVNKAKTSYQVKGFDDFTFGCAEFDKPELMESGQAILDENGQARGGISFGAAGIVRSPGSVGDGHGGGF